ncbi:MAG: hypothetical protein ABIH23_01520, partial [bacterium]
ITWDARLSAAARRLAYTVTPPDTETGVAVFSGEAGDQEITGITTMAPVTSTSIGIFQHETAVEDRAAGWWSEGAGWYYPSSGEYIIVNSSKHPTDEQITPHHFLYSEITGDFSLEAKISAVSLGHLEGTHDLAVIGVWNTLAPGSVGCLAIRWCDEDAFPAWRLRPDHQPSYEPLLSPQIQDGRLKIVREGNTYSMYYFNTTTMEWTFHGSRTLELTDPVYVGLSAMGGEDRYVLGRFSGVELILTSACADWELYK